MDKSPKPQSIALNWKLVDPLIRSEGPFLYVVSGKGASIVGFLSQDNESDPRALFEIPPSPGGLPLVDIQASALSFSDLVPQINIPNSVVSIGEGAMATTTVKSLYLPASVASIGDGAFAHNHCLQSIEVDPSNPIFCVVNHSLIRRMQKRELLRFASDEQKIHYTVPSGITSLGCRAFSSCNNLASITMDDEVHHVGEGAFMNCELLGSLRLSRGLWDIDDRAFWGCSSLAAIEIPPSVNSMGRDVFYECSPDLVLTVTEGSYAERWARENGVAYKTL